MKRIVAILIYWGFCIITGQTQASNKALIFASDTCNLLQENINNSSEFIEFKRWTHRFAIYHNAPICENQVLRLATAYLPEVVYTWLDPKGRPIGSNYLVDLLPGQISGYYKLEVCHPILGSFVDSCYIRIIPLPQPPQVIEKLRVCEGETINLEVKEARKAAQYFWILPNLVKKKAPNLELKNITLNATGHYKCYAIEQGCTSMLSKVILEVLPVPQIIKVHVPSFLCEGQNLNLSFESIPSAQYLLITPDNQEVSIRANYFVKYNISLSMGGKYQLLATLGNCTSKVSTFDIKVLPRPLPPTVIYADTFLCEGGVFSAKLLPKPGYSYFWKVGDKYFFSDTILWKFGESTNASGEYASFSLAGYAHAEGCTSEPVFFKPPIISKPSIPEVRVQKNIRCWGKDSLYLGVHPAISHAEYFWYINDSIVSKGKEFSLASDIFLKKQFTLSCLAQVRTCTSYPKKVDLDTILPPPILSIKSLSVSLGDTVYVRPIFSSSTSNVYFHWQFPNQDVLLAQELIIPDIQKENIGRYWVYNIDKTSGCTTQFQSFEVLENPNFIAKTFLQTKDFFQLDILEKPFLGGSNYNLLSSVLEGSLRSRYFHSARVGEGLKSNFYSSLNVQKNKNVSQENKNISFAFPTKLYPLQTLLPVPKLDSIHIAPHFVEVNVLPPITTSHSEETSSKDWLDSHKLELIMQAANFCDGERINLNIQELVPYEAEVLWQLPNGFTSREKKITIELIDSTFNGLWILNIFHTSGTRQFTKLVKVINRPDEPKIFEKGDFCVGGSIELQVKPVVPEYTYQWQLPYSKKVIVGPILQIAQVTSQHHGKYTLHIRNKAGCSVMISYNLNLYKDSLTVYTKQPVCPGNTIEMHAHYHEKALYSWSGPYNFSSTEASVRIFNANPGNSGEYEVYARIGECEPQVKKVNVTVLPLPKILEIAYAKPICLGNSVHFSIVPVEGVRYRWFLPSGRRMEGAQIYIDHFEQTDNGNWIIESYIGECSRRDTFSIWGFDCKNPCPLPVGWVLQKIFYNRAQVTWSSLQQHATCYILAYGPSSIDPENWQKVNITFPVNTFIIPDLLPEKEYGVQLQVNCTNCSHEDGIRSNWSPIFYFKTPPKSSTYSNVVQYSVFPEETKGAFSIFFSLEKEEVVTIKILDTQGPVLFQKQVNAIKGFNKMNIQLSTPSIRQAQIQLWINHQCIGECLVAIH
ncbi:MAG: fibronectin type III domain-containing protein [Bacteroidia bacterium]|nr:fibronectin type III domain-containing protein [Bacteroidia bacterium]